MFAGIVKQHHATSAAGRQALDKSKREAVTAVEAATKAYLHAVNDGVARAYKRQVGLEKNAKALQKQAQAFSKTTKKWLELYKGFDDALKELGDVQNWAQTIEADMDAVVRSLAYVSERARQSATPPETGEMQREATAESMGAAVAAGSTEEASPL